MTKKERLYKNKKGESKLIDQKKNKKNKKRKKLKDKKERRKFTK